MTFIYLFFNVDAQGKVYYQLQLDSYIVTFSSQCVMFKNIIVYYFDSILCEVQNIYFSMNLEKYHKEIMSTHFIMSSSLKTDMFTQLLILIGDKK